VRQIGLVIASIIVGVVAVGVAGIILLALLDWLGLLTLSNWDHEVSSRPRSSWFDAIPAVHDQVPTWSGFELVAIVDERGPDNRPALGRVGFDDEFPLRLG
jgi:hypothetical protein